MRSNQHVEQRYEKVLDDVPIWNWVIVILALALVGAGTVVYWVGLLISYICP